MEDALGRQRDVHDHGEVHLEDGQEEFHGRAPDVEVFPRRVPTMVGLNARKYNALTPWDFFTVLIRKRSRGCGIG